MAGRKITGIIEEHVITVRQMIEKLIDTNALKTPDVELSSRSSAICGKDYPQLLRNMAVMRNVMTWKKVALQSFLCHRQLERNGIFLIILDGLSGFGGQAAERCGRLNHVHLESWSF